MPPRNGSTRLGVAVAILLVMVAAVIIGLRLNQGGSRPENGDSATDHAPVAREGAPSVRLEPAVLDFGSVPPNAGLPESFDIINDGDEPITLASLTPSCSCLHAETKTSLIPPGERLRVDVRYQTGNRQDQQVAHSLSLMFEGYLGSVTMPVRSVTIHLYHAQATNDPNRITITSADGSPVSVTEHPPFVTGVITPAAPRDTVILNLRQGEEDDDRTRPSRLVLKHTRFGELVIDWPVPNVGEWPAVPRPPQPQVRPVPMNIDVPAAARGEAVVVETVLSGLRPEQVNRLDTVGDGPNPFTAKIVEHEPVDGGVRVRLELTFEHESRRTGSILFLFDGDPLCRVRVRPVGE